MADPSQPAPGGGCLPRLLVLVLLLCGLGLAAALHSVFQPQDLGDIGGYGESEEASPPARDLAVVLKNSIDRGYAVTLTEREINQWLEQTLASRQDGLLAGKASLDRVLVRLLDGHAEVVMLRHVMGRPFTVSMFLTIEQTEDANGVHTNVHMHGGPFHEALPKPPRGGRFGRLVVPQGFLLLVKPAYDRLAACFHEETRLAFQEMARIRIEENRLVLDPREPDSLTPGLPNPF
jgi:hypothetical protein